MKSSAKLDLPVIRNKVTGQEIRFIRYGNRSEVLEMQTTYQPLSTEPPPHFHPLQGEHFVVEHGELTVRVHGAIKTLLPGTGIHIPAGTPHSMWNNSLEPAVVRWRVRPALETAELLCTLFGLANDGKTDETGKPNLLQLILIADRYRDVLQLASISPKTLDLMIRVLKPVAKLLGYKASYPQYLINLKSD